MARSRNIKPGFFLNDALGSLSPIHRLLFIGLWTVADRAGRVFDRPKQIKASVLPYDNANVSRILADLHAAGFIQRYEIKGNKYIQIANFLKHQHPHIKEPESSIPAPDSHDTSTGLSTGQKRLIPDSLNLNPCAESPTRSSADPTDDFQTETETDEISTGEREYLTGTTTRKANGDWWRTNSGIDAKAAELEVSAKPGETYPALKARLFDVLNERKAQRV